MSDYPNISPVSDAGDMSCAFCGSFRRDKVRIENLHEGVGSLICQGCVNALDAWFNNHPQVEE
jgi:hypothetical protein